MGQPTFPSPALLITAAFSRYEEALAWAKRKLEAEWGAIALESPAFDFHETDYYVPTMGPGIKKIFWAFEKPFDAANLVESNWRPIAGKSNSPPRQSCRNRGR